VSDTPIAPTDDIFQMRWNNFNNSLFSALEQGLMGNCALINTLMGRNAATSSSVANSPASACSMHFFIFGDLPGFPLDVFAQGLNGKIRLGSTGICSEICQSSGKVVG
jgi:hypothetical protein